MKKLLSLYIIVCLILWPAGVFAEDTPPKGTAKKVIAETENYIVTEEVPPVLNYLGGGNFFLGDPQGFDGGVAVVSVEEQPLYAVMSHGGANDFNPTTHNAVINTKGEEVLKADFYRINFIGDYIEAYEYADKPGNYYPETETMYFDKSGKQLDTISSFIMMGLPQELCLPVTSMDFGVISTNQANM